MFLLFSSIGNNVKYNRFSKFLLENRQLFKKLLEKFLLEALGPKLRRQTIKVSSHVSCKEMSVANIDVGTGGHWGHVTPPKTLQLKKKCPFYFRKCPFFLKEKCPRSPVTPPKFEMLHMSLIANYSRRVWTCQGFKLFTTGLHISRLL